MAKRGNKKREDDLATLDQPASSTSKEFADTNTAIVEYFESIRHEYDCQAEQKTSFENRSGILLSFFGVMFVYLMDKVPIKDVIALSNTPLTFVTLLKILSGAMIYLGFVGTFVLLLLTIAVQKQKVFDVKKINNTMLEEDRYKALVRLSMSYQDAVNNRVLLNDRRGWLLKLAQYSFIVTFFAAALYLSL